jgi:signal transduction histidine kinase
MSSDDYLKSTLPSQNASSLDTQQLSRELNLFLEVRPYVLKCLSLNHDINNPLTGILGFGEILMDDESLTAEQKGYLKQIMTCAERIRKEVNSLSEEKVALQEKVDLRELIELFSKTNAV